MPTDRTPRLLLLDAASLYFRAFYGVPDQRKSAQEAPTNAVRGFLDMVATLISAHRPTHLVACWDNDWRPQFRVDLIPSYKAHRVAGPAEPVPAGEAPDQEHPATGGLAEEVPDDLEPQVPLIVDALKALGIARVGVDGYEADDVIGAYVERLAGTMPIDVVTGDRDLFQLVDDAHQVRVLYTARSGVRDAQAVDEAFLWAHYGVANGAAYLDMSILRGDTSDGLPGVKGIGEKTAAALVEEFGSLAGIRRAVADGDPRIKGARRTNLEAGSGYLDAAPEVVAVARQAPLPDDDLRLPTRVHDARLLSELASGYGLTGSLNRVLAALDLGTETP
jgi:5'-3' exonuclease